jgi:PAS domain S-box-containing protein
LTEALARADDPRFVYETALAVLRRALQVDRASVLTFDEAGVARFRAWAGLSDEYRRAVEGHSPWSRGETSPKPLLIRDVREDASLAGYSEVFASEDIRALAFIPLIGSEGCLGKFMLYYRDVHEITPEELELATVISTQVAFATERVIAAEAHRKQSDLLAEQAALLSLAHDAILVLAMDGTIEYWNRGAERLYGWTAAEAMGRIAHQLLQTVFVEAWVDMRAQLEAQGIWQGELVHTTKAGDRRTVSSRWALRRDEHGDACGILEINRNVTGQREQEIALQKSEELLSLATRSTRMGTFDYYPEDGRLVWSAETKRHFGLPPEAEVNYDTFLRGLHPDDRNRVERVVQGVLDGTAPPDYETEYRTIGPEDGRQRWIAARGHAFFDGSARASRFLGITLDITERKRQEQRVSDTLNSIRESFIALDRNWTLTYVNDRVARLLGKPPEELIGRRIWDVAPDYQGTAFHENYRRVLEERIALKFDVWSPDGTACFEVHAYPTEEGLSAYVLEITERRATERALRHSEERYRCLVEALSAVVWRANARGAFDEPQPAWERYTGQAWQDQQERKWLDAFHPDDRERVSAAWSGAAAGRKSFRTEARLWNAEASAFHLVNLTAVPMTDGDGGVREWIGTVSDIHEQRAFEEKLQHAAKLESLGLLAGGIAHDFNNLLVGILGGASLLQEELEAQPELKAIADTVAQAGERARQLTQQMLAYSGRGHFEVRPLKIAGEVREIIALVTASVPKHVRLVLDLPEDLPAIEADAGQLQQLVMNLVINAAEAIPITGTVRVKAYRQTLPAAIPVATGELAAGDYAVLEVRDDGTGMDAATKSKIFDPFFTTKFTGRGLGLAAALGIVRGHRGGIEVESVPGRGTAFLVFLPCSDAEFATDRAAPAEPGAGSGTVLVIDDEPVVAATARAALEKRGYKVITAANGQEGILAFVKNFNENPLVLLDMTMPLMGGQETFLRLRTVQATVRVVGMSGYTELEAQKQFGAGLAGFIQKPFTAADLCRTVQSACSLGSHPG